MTPRRILLGAVFLWCALIYATPLLVLQGGSSATIAGFSYRFFSHICNQLDSHSFFFHGAKFPVCVRCTSIYTAFLLSVLAFPLFSRLKIFHSSPRWLLAVASVPMAVDVGLAAVGIHTITTATRLITGAWFGLFIGIVLTPLLLEVLIQVLNSFHKNLTGVYHETKA
jgi:uncharacterized membrane protein